MDEWLKSVGLEHRRAAFQAEGIARDQLAELTEEDLKELGLTIGERRRFRRAILELHAPAPSAPLPPSTLTERRPLTMMFVDLVGSSDLGERLEPEDLLEVVRRYREFCGAAIRRVGGAVARQVGDGILAYFSYPVATENDPERAVRAALEIARDIEHLASPAPEPLAVRIGIASGRVIISDMLAGGAADLRTIIGSPPNLAARLQGIAKPGGIVIAQETHERVRELFACEDLGLLEMRGFAAPRHAWRVLHDLPRRGWGGTAQPQRLTPFCARHAELAVLGERWADAVGGRGGAVLVSGEAGIGKSRLIETFLSLRCLEDCRVLQLVASPFDVDSPLHPFAAWLRAEAEAGGGADPGTASPAQAELADLLGLTWPAGAPPAPAQLREQTLAALAERVRGLAEREPLCLVVEDLHWLDPSSLELLGRLVTSLDRQRILLLLTARDGFAPSWLAGPPVRTLPLARLAAADVSAMVHGLLEQMQLPARLAGQVVRKADGVPLFVVELLRGLMQPDGLAADLPGGDEPGGDIPGLLRDLLMARLDRAGLAKEVAQVAAVIGRSVRPATLAAVAGRPTAELDPALATLVTAGVLFRDQGGAAASYTFSHALLRDAAYDSVLRDQRQALHARIAAALPRLEAAAVARQPELLALHLSEGGQPAAAAPHWIEAARRSLGRSALTEAKRLLQRGLAALDKAPAGAGSGHAPAGASNADPPAVDLRLEMMTLLGPALIGLSGPGSAEAQDLYAQAWQLCSDLPEHRSHFPITWGWWRMSRDFADKLGRAEALVGRARLRADNGVMLQAHHCAWASHYCVGALAQCCEHAAAGLAIYGAGDYGDHARLYGNHDAQVCAHGELAQAFWQRGQPVTALDHERRSLAWARDMKHLGSLAHAMDMRLLHRAYRRDVAEVLAQADELMAFTAEHGLADHHAKGLIFRGWALARGTDAAAGQRMLEDGIARQREIGTDEDFPVYLSLLADVLIRAGEADRAAAILGAARAEFDAIGLTVWIPELSRLLAVATVAADPSSVGQALAWFDAATRMATSQGAAMLALRIAISAGRLNLRLGEPGHGALGLVAARAAVPEDDGGADMRAAQALAMRFRELGLAVEPVG